MKYLNNKKRWLRFLLLILCLMFVQLPAIGGTSVPARVEAATVKKGLKKEGGKYYYYQNGKKVKNTWKTVKTTKNGKTVSYKYYFGSNGAAYAGTKTDWDTTIAFKKIGGKYYGFNASAQMVTGIYVSNDSFYVFNEKTGVYDASATKKLRAASKYQKNAATLRKLLGKPSRTETTDGCYGDGEELILYYPHFMVNLYRDKKGKEIVLGVMSR
jgi:hypothetical protein